MIKIFKKFFKKQATIFSNPNGRPKIKIDMKKVLLLKDVGKSNYEIAKIMGVSEATIRRRLKEYVKR